MSYKHTLGTFLALGLASCSASPSVLAQSSGRCGPAEIAGRMPEFQASWRALKQKLWALQDGLTDNMNGEPLNRLAHEVIANLSALPVLKVGTPSCVEVEAFMFRMVKAGSDLNEAIQRSDMFKARDIAAAIDRDFPYAPDAKTTAYLYPSYSYRAPYRSYYYGGLHHGGFASHGLHSHHGHH